MSIFNNVRGKLYSKETELFVLFKYGEPNHTDEYFEKIPNAVILSALEKASPAFCRRPPHNSTTDIERQVLSIMLRQPINQSKARRALIDSLVEFHMLLG
jgi:hypothetical protein